MGAALASQAQRPTQHRRSTVAKCYRLLRTMFTTAVEDELIAVTRAS